MTNLPRPHVLAAVPTPFSESGRIDIDRAQALVSFLAASGVDGLFVCGTAGEFPALNRSERKAVARAVIDAVGDTCRVIIHVGAVSYWEVERLVDDAREIGAQEIAVIAPYFLPSDRAAMFRFFEQVSMHTEGLRTYLYLYRTLCGNSITPNDVRSVAQLPNICGAKISGESPETIAQFCQGAPTGFEIYAGADQELVAMAQHGARGVVSAMSAALPTPFLRLADAWSRRDVSGVSSWQRAVDDVCAVIDGQIPRTKLALALQGIDVGSVRMALPPATSAINEITRIVKAYSSGTAALRAGSDRIPVSRSPKRTRASSAPGYPTDSSADLEVPRHDR
jgi:4-hydroxy-tetrahydrodipicolinate synthase